MMASYLHNPIRKRFILALFLISCFALHALAQEAPTTLEAILALPEPSARIDALQKSLRAQPDAEVAEQMRAELTRAYAMVGESQLADKNIDPAVETFRKAIAAFPNNVDDKFFEEVAARIPLAVSVRGYRTEAILLAREMEARFAKEAKRLAALGEFYMSVEAPVEALRAMNAALKSGAEDARIYRTLGSAYRLNLDLDKALVSYQQAIKLDPQDRRAYFELGNLQRSRGNYDAAINLYQQQLKIDPQHYASLKALGVTYLFQRKDDLAEEALATAAKLSETDLRQDFFLQTQLTMAYLSRGNVVKARQAADAAIAGEPRYSWGRIAAAEVDLAEGKYFEAERHILAAMRYADFPSLQFLLGKVYLAVEDFDGAVEQFGKAFSYKGGKFQTKLGGILELQGNDVNELLARERQAALFQSEPITSLVEFRLAENLVKFDEAVRTAKQSSSGLVTSILLSQSANKSSTLSIEKNVNDFIETEASRKAFRLLYAAERLVAANQSLDVVLRYTEQAIDVSDRATAQEGSLKDFPNYDRDGRLRLFRGRALTLRGRALLKLGRKTDAISTLEEAIDTYGVLPERKRAQWQLAMAKESAGKNEEALDLYIAAYEAPQSASFGADLNRTVIESLYRRTYGSLDGLNERIGRPREGNLLANNKPLVVNGLANAAAANLQASEVTTPTPVPPVAESKNSEPEASNVPVTSSGEPPVPKPETAPNTAALTTSVAAAPLLFPVPAAIALVPDATLLSTKEIALQFSWLESNDAEPVRVEKAIQTELAAKPVASTEPLTSADRTLTEIIAAATSSNENRAVVPVASENVDAKPETNPVAPENADAKPEINPVAPENIGANSEAKPEKTAVVEPEPIVPTPIAVELPPAPIVPFILLPGLDPEPNIQLDWAATLITAPDAAPFVLAKVETATTVNPPEKTSEPGTQSVLSDSKVAEIERTIEAAARPGGKKGDAAAAIAESSIGHKEGDQPVRRPAQAISLPLPLGESGHATDPVSAATPSESLEGGASGLPRELERRASEMGESAGKLSAGAAMEVKAPDKPVGVGRKGVAQTSSEAEKEVAAPAVRPRRVKEN